MLAHLCYLQNCKANRRSKSRQDSEEMHTSENKIQFLKNLFGCQILYDNDSEENTYYFQINWEKQLKSLLAICLDRNWKENEKWRYCHFNSSTEHNSSKIKYQMMSFRYLRVQKWNLIFNSFGFSIFICFISCQLFSQIFL